MGSSSSSSDGEEELKQKPIQSNTERRKVIVRGSVYNGYQPGPEGIAAAAKKNRVMMKHKSLNYEQTTPRNKDTETPKPPDNQMTLSSTNPNMHFVSNEDRSNVLSAQQRRTEVVLSPTMLQPKITEVIVPSLETSNNNSKPNSAPASSFEKAPVVQINYVAKPSDKNARHIYDQGNITVVRRMPSKVAGSSGGRWYDNDYNKN